MQIFLSPSKTMDPNVPKSPMTSENTGYFSTQSKELWKRLGKIPEEEWSSRGGLSAKKAREVFLMHQEAWNPTLPAARTYTGNTYQGLNSAQWKKEDWDWAQERLKIFSALYGILGPATPIQPYRLDYKTVFPDQNIQALTSYWKTRIQSLLKTQHANEVFLNLASGEFAFLLKGFLNLITPTFLEKRGDRYQNITTFSKKARGLMANWCIQNRIENPEELRNFQEGGYWLNLKDFGEGEWVFTREA